MGFLQGSKIGSCSEGSHPAGAEAPKGIARKGNGSWSLEGAEGTRTVSTGAAADVQGLRGFLSAVGAMLCKRQEQTSISRNLWGLLCQEDLSVLEGQADQTPVGMQDGPGPLRRKGRRRRRLLTGVGPAGRIE